MKILHLCLGNFYVEGMGYQENIITKTHARLGHEVTLLTSDYAFNNKGEHIRKENKDYVNQYGVHVKVLDKDRRFGYLSRYRIYKNLYNEIQNVSPDVIFVHGGQFLSLRSVIKYVKKHSGVRMYIDQHGDYYNMPVKGFKNCVRVKYIYGFFMKKAIKYCTKFWGVTPWRCQFLNEVYGIPKAKIGLLTMGGDDEMIHFDKMPSLRSDIRKKLDISDDDFVVITGGKLDRAKNIHLLMQAVAQIENDRLKLVVFGTPNDDMKETMEKLKEDSHIRYIGWLAAEDVYDYFLASDLAVFPGTHSVLWEQACACGLPCVVKDWVGMRHIDVGGNCIFLYNDSIDEIKGVVEELSQKAQRYIQMKDIAVNKGIKEFSYVEISKRAIGE